MKITVTMVSVSALAAGMAVLAGCSKGFDITSAPVPAMAPAPASSPSPTPTPAVSNSTVTPTATASVTAVWTAVPPAATSTPVPSAVTPSPIWTVSVTPSATLTAAATSTATPALPTPSPQAAPADDIAFAAPDFVNPGSMRLYKVHPDGTGLTALTDPSLKVFHPSWSPDKSRIVFEGYGTSPSQLYIVNADGTALAAIPGTAAAGAPAWSPDGTRIAFVSYSAGTAQLCSIHPDGTGLTQLTHESGGVSPEDFAWSPDSQRIAYSTMAQTRIMDADGSNVMDFPLLMKQMDWSPDGQSFVFDAYVSTVNNLNIWQVFKVGVDGTGLVPLTEGDSHGGACWSKDGSRIVVVDLLAQGPPNMSFLNPDGSDAAPLPNAFIYYCYQPCWH